MSTVTAPNPFVTEASSGGGGDFELPPAGNHPAYCVGLVDLGTHDRQFNGKTDEVHKILFVWELTAEHQSNGDTFIVHRAFTWSLNVKAKLRPFLEGWLGRTISDGEKVDFAALVGRPCVVNLAEGTSGAGKKYVDVTACGPPLRGLTVPPTTVHPFLFALSQITSCKDDPPIPSIVPPYMGRAIVDEIKSSKEWGKLPPF